LANKLKLVLVPDLLSG